MHLSVPAKKANKQTKFPLLKNKKQKKHERSSMVKHNCSQANKLSTICVVNSAAQGKIIDKKTEKTFALLSSNQRTDLKKGVGVHKKKLNNNAPEMHFPSKKANTQTKA